jgi:outer membrane murein-binding lipoprotein Lpp
MIDPSFDTQPVETVPPFPPTMQELETKIDQLNNALASMTADRDFWQARAHDRQMMIDNLEQYVKEQYDYIDEEISQSLVDIFGLSISKDYDVTVTVTFSGTVSVPLNYDMDNLENDLSASLESHYYSADVEADFSEDRMEIDWSES